MGMREKLIELLCKAHNAVTDKSLENDSEFGMTYAEQLETEADSLIANGVTIPVRCKDCKGWVGEIKRPEGRCLCQRRSWWVFGDDYCSYGERRTDA